MFESQSNTPESAQDSTTPEPFKQAAVSELFVAQLEAEVTRLKSEIEIAKARLEQSQLRERDYYSDLTKARDLIQEVLAGDTDAESTFDAFRAPFELLGVSLTREVEIEITMTWRGTIELPHGTDPEDLDIDDFASCDPDHNFYQTYFNQGIHDSDIREI